MTATVQTTRPVSTTSARTRARAPPPPAGSTLTAGWSTAPLSAPVQRDTEEIQYLSVLLPGEDND